MYQARANGEFTITNNSGKNIASVKFTYNSEKNGVIVYGSDQIASGSTYEFSDTASTRTFRVGNTDTATNGQARITAFEIVCQ